jgi:hypothetical protein
MWKMGLKLIIGCLCGYLYIHLSLIDSPSSVIEGFIIFILPPLRFFLAVLMFLIGLVMNAHLIKWLLYKTFELWRKKKYWNFGLFIFYVGFIISTAYLINLDLGHTLIFFSFSVVYGIISMDA